MDTKRLRQRVLDLAIHGKLVPQNPQDEPASELLKRIAAEKERLIKEGKIKKSKKKDNEDIDEVPFEVPQGWVWCRLEDVCLDIADIDHRMPQKTNEGIPYISPMDFTNDGKINYDEAKKISYEDYLELSKKCKPEKGDIIFPRYGTIGVLRIIDTSKKILVSYSCATIKTGLSNIYHKYIYYVLLSNHIQINEITKYINDTTQANIGLQSIKLFKFPLPPLAEQHRIVSEVEKYFSLIDILEESENDLQQSIQKAKSKILDLAIKGKLVEQNEEDEPASVLLERIKEEKNKNEKKGKIKDTEKINEVPFEVPQGWVWCRLGEVCNIQSSKRIHKENYVDEGIPFYRTTEIKELSEGKDISNCLYISEEQYNSIKNRFGVPTQGDILISAVGTIGITYVIPDNSPFYFKDGNLIWIEKSNSYFSPFLSIILGFFVAEKDSISTSGSAYNALTIEKLNTLLFPLPPFAEQHRIVAKIEELFNQLDNIAEALK